MLSNENSPATPLHVHAKLHHEKNVPKMYAAKMPPDIEIDGKEPMIPLIFGSVHSVTYITITKY